MASKSKQKGDRAEREIVQLHLEAGISAQRIPLSGAAGGLFKGDIRIGEFTAEVKSRRNGAGFVTIEEWLATNDILFLRRDRQQPMVVMPWKTYCRLIKSVDK